jgi:two-component system sensor histidine kinase KdpD
VAPISGAIMVFNLSEGMPAVLRAVLMLTVLGVLLQGVIARRLWIAYAAATVAVLAALTSATFDLPAAALVTQWVAFAAVVGVALYLVGRLRDQHDELRTVDDMRTRFIALTNHELRTPVAVLYSVLETLEEDLQTSLSPQQQGFLRAARESSHELAERVELLTQMQHLRQHDTPDQRRAPFGDIVSDVTGALATNTRGVDLQTNLDDAAASIELPAIDTGIVLRQVITNAIKFSPSSSIVEIRASVSDGELICEITDDGPGIPAGQESAIFEAFYQPGDVMRREADGLGVGLSLAKMASRRMGATVQVRNRASGGARVSLRIPAPSQPPVPFPSSAQRAVPA